ncbi:MAG: hypothetical protein U0Y68_09940 [Blastocatellia bacterium]
MKQIRQRTCLRATKDAKDLSSFHAASFCKTPLPALAHRMPPPALPLRLTWARLTKPPVLRKSLLPKRSKPLQAWQASLSVAPKYQPAAINKPSRGGQSGS